jgi:hypothetical protein
MDKKLFGILGLIVLLVFTLLYWTRFQVIDVHSMNGVGFYKIDRLTGETVLVSGLDQIRVLPVKDLEQPQLQFPAPGKGQQ